MAEYFETDEITKGYDPDIARRIFSYVKPYRKEVLATIFALILSTAGELAIPVVMQDTIDNALMVSWTSIDETDMKSPEIANLGLNGGDPVITGKVFFRTSRLSGITGKNRGKLSDSGIIKPEKYYVFRVTENPELRNILRVHSDFITSGTTHAFLETSRLASLSETELAIVRNADSVFISTRILILGLSLVIVLFATFLQTRIASLIGQKVMKDLRTELFDKTLRQSLAWLGRQPTGRLVTRMTGDVETINEFFTNVVVSFIKDSSVMAGVLITLFILSPTLGLVTVITLIPVVFITAIGRVKARDAFRKQRKAVSKVNSFLSEHLSGIQVVQLFTKEKASAVNFAKHNAELTKANLGEMYVLATFRPIIDFFTWISTAAIILAGAWMFLGTAISLGIVVAYINLIRMFYSPVQDISEKYTLLQSAMAGGERVFKLLDTNEMIPDTGKEELPERLSGKIEFTNVWFSYKEGEEVLKGLSFEAAPGETIAIVGYTGAGKTTVINLITRLWDIRKGEIKIDGIDVREIRLSALRTKVQSVLQEVFLFSGTVGDNIKLGSGISDEEMIMAAKTVHAHNFISLLPDGYKTILSEGAANISAGQRQLLSFARVVAHDPSILILDEATSSIDTETERLIQESLEAMLKGRTSIIIAHRLSTIRHADRIIVMGSGHVIESGTHEELIARKGAYSKLYHLQYGKELTLPSRERT